MAKDKKAKKGRAEETGEEVVTKNTQDILASGKTVQKGKKTKKDDDISDSIDGVENLSLEDKLVRNSKKNKKSGNDEDDESSDMKNSIPADEDTKSRKKEKRSKKGKSIENEIAVDLSKHKDTKLESHISSEDEDEKTTKHRMLNKPTGFGLLAIDDDDDVDESKDDVVVEDQPVSKISELDLLNGTEQGKTESKGKKSKKKERRKRNDDDDEDIEKLLEELALEMTGQKPPEATVTEESSSAEVTSILDVEKVEPEPKQSKKKKNKTVEAETMVKVENDEETDLPIEEQHTVKTAAEKKKEKKEKEKQKKAAKFEQSRSSKASKEESKQNAEKPAEEISVPVPEVEEPDDEEKKEEDEGDDKKKKKKKKDKKDEDEKKDKKRPGKRQIAAMQDALKKVREEEERLRLIEEEKIRAAEEAETLRLEKLRLEQERKEKKKLKEKEKRERLKAEGKLLTKTQRQNRARMEATLAALRQQGVEVPEIGEKKERAPRLGDRKRSLKKRNETVQEDDDKDETALAKDSSPEIESPEKKIEESVAEKGGEEEEEEEDGDVKDTWDQSSSEDEQSELSTKVEIVVKEKSDVKDESDVSGSLSSDESESSDEEESESEETSESEDDGKKNEERLRERVIERIRKRQEDAETNRNPSKLRSPVVCVLGHVDTGKTKILDKIRKTNIQDGEAGGITQQIGATMIPKDALNDQCKMVKNFPEMELKLPGLLIIDTPGHESFSNLRSRGSSLCDIAVLVVDIMHGLEPQTIESINLLKQKKTPFIVALNKIDRLYEWKSLKNRDVEDVIKSQARNTKMEFDDRAKDVILQFANQGLNAVLHYENTDPRTYISMVPTSALTGDGMGNLLALVVQLTQTMMIKRLMFSEELQATVLEVKAIPGLGTTIDTILVNGLLQEGNTIVFAGYDGPVVTQIRSLLMPQPLKELRVKNIYKEYKEVEGAQGVKITGKDLDKAIAGLQLLVAHHPDEVPILKDEVATSFKEAMGSIKVADRGVYVQASTLGSLEALLEFLRASKIPYSGIRIGPVVKRDVMKASIMLEHDSQYAVILAFDVKIEKDAQELADSLGVKIFQADIIYHLFDKFIAYREELKNKKRDEFKSVAVFPCKLRILPNFVFNSRDPIVCGVIVEAGVVKEGTPLCVPSKEFLEIGTVTTIEVNHKTMEMARKGQEVCIKIEPVGGESPKMFGRHFDHTDMLVSKITRQSIDVCKEYFRDDLQKTDWQLMVELKKIFQIL